MYFEVYRFVSDGMDWHSRTHGIMQADSIEDLEKTLKTVGRGKSYGKGDYTLVAEYEKGSRTAASWGYTVKTIPVYLEMKQSGSQLTPFIIEQWANDVRLKRGLTFAKSFEELARRFKGAIFRESHAYLNGEVGESAKIFPPGFKNNKDTYYIVSKFSMAAV